MTQGDLFGATFLPQDIRANRFRKPEDAREIRTPGTSGQKYVTLCKPGDPLGAFLKTFMGMSAWGSTLCLMKWTVQATPQRRLLYRLRVSGLPTRETESSLLPTPTTQDNPQVRGEGKTVGTKRGTTLGGYARMWPTPRTTDVTGGPRKLDEQGRRISQSNPDLKFGANLADIVKDPDQPTGKLNPQWVEWLMGYPEGWTELKD